MATPSFFLPRNLPEGPSERTNVEEEAAVPFAPLKPKSTRLFGAEMTQNTLPTLLMVPMDQLNYYPHHRPPSAVGECFKKVEAQCKPNNWIWLISSFTPFPIGMKIGGIYAKEGGYVDWPKWAFHHSFDAIFIQNSSKPHHLFSKI